MEKYDFSGWATKANLKCSDGRVIAKDAFKHMDGATRPLVWMHQHNDPNNVLGNALLEHRDEGIYAYCKFNDTDSGRTARQLVEHGDVSALSICANQLRQQGANVMHGEIREISLVLAGANPGAFIDSVIQHDDGSDEEAIIYTGESIELFHADEEVTEEVETTETEELTHADEGEAKAEEKSEPEAKEEPKEETIAEILDTLTEKQQAAVCAVIGELVGEDEPEEEKEDEKSEGGNETMKHNVFEDKDNQTENTLMHADVITSAIGDMKRYGSLKESLLQHAAANNITEIGELFPMEKDLTATPSWIKEDDSWVAKVMGAVHHTPFSRVRALFAKMDEAEARARGYIKKGELKKDLKLAVLKRTTAPTTVYIKMKMDRDDLLDISFDAIPWIRAEARKNLDRELALAFLLGDGRDDSSDDKIDPLCIRPIVSDDDMYTIKYTVTDGKEYHNDFNSASENDSEAKGVVRAAVKARKQYKGSGTPTFFTTEDLLTELLLIEDQNGRRIYESIATLATAMRVKEIVTVPEMESHDDIYGIIVNMNDYNTGADKGGAVSMFEDFDIDYNQQKYLMETRCSGALVKPYSAIVLKKASAAG